MRPEVSVKSSHLIRVFQDVSRIQAISMSTSTSASISVGDNPGRASGTRSSQDGLPDAYELVVTTTSNVLVWTNNKVTSLFTSGTGGIVAAKRISSNMLAVADSSVVVLHNIKKGKRKSYHLKDSQVRHAARRLH